MKTKTKLSFQKLLDKTGRTQYTDKDVVALVEPCEAQEIEFFTLSKYITDEQLDIEYAQRGLQPASPYSLALYDEVKREILDEKKYVATHWRDKNGKWCFATFCGWGGERSVRVDRDDGEWRDDWWFAGVRKSLGSSSSDSESLPLSPLTLDRAIAICKENGLVVYKSL